MDSQLYSIEDARRVLGGISRATIYDLLNRGELASVVIGRRRFIPAASIAVFIGSSSTTVAPRVQRAVGNRRITQMSLNLGLPPGSAAAAARRGRPRGSLKH